MTAPLPPSRSDAGLVARYLAGDRHALADIYERYADQVHHRCTALTASSAEADRAFRDTFLSAAHVLDDLQEPAALGDWLLRVADIRCGARVASAGAVATHVPATPITLWSDVLTELMADPIPVPAPLPPAAPVAAPAPAPSRTPASATTRSTRWRPAWVEPFVGPASALVSVAAATTALMIADAVVHQLTTDDGSGLIGDPAAADPSTTAGPVVDTTPPAILTTSVSETTFLSCRTVGGIVARVTDEELVAAVHTAWAVGDDGGGVDLTRGDADTWTGNVGPFTGLVTPLGPEGVPVTFTVTAIDGSGNLTTAPIEIPATVRPC